MLARGALTRLAAEVPKQAAHDLPKLTPCRLSAHRALSLPIRALTHVSQLQTRSYATRSAETDPAAPVKRAVKARAAAGKSVSNTTRRPKQVAAKKKKAAPKKAKKKAAPKKTAPKRAKKPLTDAQKQTALIKKLREIALREPVDRTKMSAYNVFVAEGMKDANKDANVKQTLARVAQAYKDISPAERERLNHAAATQNTARLAAYKAWVTSHTVDEIRLANNARAQLRRRLAGKYKGSISYTKPIADERRTKRPSTAWAFFFAERQTSEDFRGIRIPERSRLISGEWKVLSVGEKQRFQDMAAADKQRYLRETAARATSESVSVSESQSV